MYSKRLGLLNCIAKRHFGDTGKYNDYINEVLADEGNEIKDGCTVIAKYDVHRKRAVSYVGMNARTDSRCPFRGYAYAKPFVVYEDGGWDYVTNVILYKPDSLEKLRDDATKPPRQYYADYIGHGVGLKDDEEINTDVHKHIIDRAVAIMGRDA